MSFGLLIALIVSIVGYGAFRLFTKKRDEIDQDTAGEGSSKRRRSDGKILGGAHKAAYQQAQRLAREGNVKQAAKILEQMNMHREAIIVLEQAGCISEAAGILMRMNLPHRAGHILAKYEIWGEAIVCFRAANLSDKVEFCSVQLSKTRKETDEVILKANALADSGQHLEAAQLYFKNGALPQALREYRIIAKSGKNLGLFTLESKDAKFLCQEVDAIDPDLHLVDLLLNHGNTHEVLIELLRKQSKPVLDQILRVAQASLFPQILKREDVTDDEKYFIGDMLSLKRQFDIAGRFFEEVKAFERAGNAFEMNRDYSAAIRCYEQAELESKAAEMRFLANEQGLAVKDSLGPALFDNAESNPIRTAIKEQVPSRAEMFAKSSPFALAFPSLMQQKVVNKTLLGEADSPVIPLVPLIKPLSADFANRRVIQGRRQEENSLLTDLFKLWHIEPDMRLIYKDPDTPDSVYVCILLSGSMSLCQIDVALVEREIDYLREGSIFGLNAGDRRSYFKSRTACVVGITAISRENIKYLRQVG